MLRIKSGYGTATLPLWAVFNLYVIFICTSIPGLAITPIMGDLTKIFPGTTQLESQMLEIGPNIACIPFEFLGGWIGTKFNNNRLTTWTCLFYGICGVLFFVVPNMITLIILSFLIGIAAGVLSPLSTAFIADMFNGDRRTAQYGYTSATLNLVLMGCVIATGYLAKINWRLPFLIYLLPFVPLFFAKGFGKYIPTPAPTKDDKGQKIHYKFSQQVNMGMLIRYCAYYFFITLVIASISMYIPFRFTDSSVAGDLTSILFFGIMASGYTLNWCVRVLRGHVAVIVMLFVLVGFAMIALFSNAWLVGVGILIATYFYGIAQPYYYARLSTASTRVALTLTLAIFASMDSFGNVIAPFVIDGIGKIFGINTSADPNSAFVICMWMCVVAFATVVAYKIIATAKRHEEAEHLDKIKASNDVTGEARIKDANVVNNHTDSATPAEAVTAAVKSAAAKAVHAASGIAAGGNGTVQPATATAAVDKAK